ncbi:SMC-Scp complex subunit ScpB [Sporolactobacillus sp. Y61]|uniref:Segregation and condensation protein B n=1 Tax=Sporolactobacillus sp. Y61 TaxID=3160863 RepID=A0AAU8IE11_9BACL|nr:SMC-Scp complex subunit ScpB [Sporolactobacillus sp. THM19-2]RYL93195.1 SMC-Scp complex subunit ScpB [Sporolactobacillus sp. THM19-2]
MTPEKLHSIIEGLLFLTGEEGVQIKELSHALSGISQQELTHVIAKLKQEYKNDKCGLMIVDIPGGYRMTTKPFMAEYAEKFAAIPKSSPLSQAALETVAIVAYKQPVSRITIDEIRGVKSDRALQTLMVRGLIKEVGRAEGPGRAILYGVTTAFLDYFGLHSLDDMPSLHDAAGQPKEQMDAYDLFYDRYKETVKDL